MRIATVKLSLAFIAVLHLTSAVIAQPVFQLKPSIEGIVLNADTVVVSRVIDFAQDAQYYKMSIEVENTLTGKHQKTAGSASRRSLGDRGASNESIKSCHDEV